MVDEVNDIINRGLARNHLVNECMHNLKHAVCIPTELFSSSERHRP